MDLSALSAWAERRLPEFPSECEPLLERLTGSERVVLALRYGLQGETRHTLREVADKFGTTTSRIDTIRRRAIRRLHEWASIANLFPLDEAWRDAEASLPKGRIDSLVRNADDTWEVFFSSAGVLDAEVGPTPAAALRALAATLRQREDAH